MTNGATGGVGTSQFYHLTFTAASICVTIQFKNYGHFNFESPTNPDNFD